MGELRMEAKLEAAKVENADLRIRNAALLQELRDMQTASPDNKLISKLIEDLETEGKKLEKCDADIHECKREHAMPTYSDEEIIRRTKLLLQNRLGENMLDGQPLNEREQREVVECVDLQESASKRKAEEENGGAYRRTHGRGTRLKNSKKPEYEREGPEIATPLANNASESRDFAGMHAQKNPLCFITGWTCNCTALNPMQGRVCHQCG